LPELTSFHSSNVFILDFLEQDQGAFSACDRPKNSVPQWAYWASSVERDRYEARKSIPGELDISIYCSSLS
jgi:hypothetical protein